VEDPHTWLIEPALHETQQGGLVMFCRSGAGKTYSCVSSDRGKSWTKPAPLPGGKTNDLVKNPNSKVSLVTIDNQILMVHHPSSVDRSPLVLSLSVDDGKTWEQLAVLEGSAEMGGSSGGGIMPSQASMLNNTKTANNNTKSNISSNTTTNGNPSSSTMQYNGDPKAVIGGNALNYSYPCITQWTEDTVKVVYTVWGEGVRMVTATLATVDT
jgi:predicted neuraminidase